MPRYVLRNRRGQRLSGFYPHSTRPWLVYRRNDYYCYTTPEEAASHQRYIQDHGVGRNLEVEIDN